MGRYSTHTGYPQGGPHSGISSSSVLAHNGSFLSSLFASPGKNHVEAYIHQKEKVKTARKAFEDGAATDDIPATIEIGVSRVVAELKKKNIVIDDAKKTLYE
jgi:hypothetical protein